MTVVWHSCKFRKHWSFGKGWQSGQLALYA